MVLGNFELDFEDGEIRFKTSVGLGAGEQGSRGAGELGRRGDGETGRRGDGETGRRGAAFPEITNPQTPPTLRSSRPSAPPPLFGLIQEIVYTNVMVMDEYLPGIRAILETDQSPHAAVQAIETQAAHIEG